ncbi:TetR/AcrR family transcriptional regulator [Microvirga sp. SRT01]|uniref:TetR/AcrR family transcriptional regulator n=1 Tax=Sphingomonas longa TaxID=2778730 RepID=A0ABS2D3Q6_9SPHN|nr:MULTISPECIES: TetR/AcrR family transcriptional regulator [Alphaproteobacteria]MBM6575546.1 TetR/AcrR family transcriptional regulator [Sphingomonas sp. BT552]MBR7708594.1 TetR/AcrR family transcriptional regulator [Microvirga sp. SRT01]
MSIAPFPRRRLSPDESRSVALDAARALLIETGPQSVTLKAVAGRVGRTHANLLHHFGSAAGLQKALAERMAADITATIGEAVLAARARQRDPRAIVDLTFDAFDKEGAGALASWMILSGNRDALDPILIAIHRLVDQLGQATGIGTRPIAEETLQLVLLALGDALLGQPMADALGLPRTRARELALAALLGSEAARDDESVQPA